LLGFAMSTHPDDPDDIVATTCGTALPGFEFRLVQPDTPLEVAPGEAGELLVKGRRLIEYSAMPAAEQARFYDADGWFRTGDLLRQRSDGRYQFVGRIKDLIKVSGENVAAAEIEDLLRGHPAVHEVAVLGVPDAQRGEVPIAFVETVPGSALPDIELAEWCRKRVAPFKVPREFHAVAAADWPRTPSGKIAKWRLAETV
jgi:fatty-acyl-CoA synthase